IAADRLFFKSNLGANRKEGSGREEVIACTSDRRETIRQLVLAILFRAQQNGQNAKFSRSVRRLRERSMNDDFKSLASANIPNPIESDVPTQGMSSIYRLFEAFIGLREKNERQHKLFEQTLNRARDSLEGNFNKFAADTQKAYQQLKQDV